MNDVVTDWSYAQDCRISCFHAFWCFSRPILANCHIANVFLVGYNSGNYGGPEGHAMCYALCDDFLCYALCDDFLCALRRFPVRRGACSVGPLKDLGTHKTEQE